MESRGHSKMLWKYRRSQNLLPMCISTLHNMALMLLVSDIKGLMPWVYFFDRYLMSDSILTLDTQIVTPLTRNILIRMQRTYLGHETRKWCLWESKKTPCFVPFSGSHLKTDWGLPPLYSDSIPFKVPENPAHLRGQSWVEGRADNCVIHLVSSSGRRALIWLQLVQDWVFGGFQQFSINKNHLTSR